MIIVISVLGMLLGFGYFVFTHDVFNARTALTPKPEPFTELYFEDHLSLPISHPSNQPLNFAFTINNLEFQPTTYQVEVTAVDEDQATASASLLTQTLTLDHNQKQTLEVSGDVSEFTGLRTKVEVKLIDQEQSIHLWLNVVPATISATIQKQ